MNLGACPTGIARVGAEPFHPASSGRKLTALPRRFPLDRLLVCRVCQRRSDADPSDPAAGFTLLEMLAVMTILSILIGLSLGFLQRGSSDLDVARSMLRDQVRLAHTTAKARGLPTEVVITPARPNQSGRIQARVLVPVGAWHLEPNEKWFDQALLPQLTGKPDPAGRFGGAWRPDPTSQMSMLRVATGTRATFDLREGFAFRIELRLDARAPASVARLGRAFTLTLDADAVPEVKLTLADPGPRPGPTVTASAKRPLPLSAWCTLELVHDGASLILVVDGAEEARVSAKGSVFQEGKDLFEVSLGNAPIQGLVDEIQILAYQPADPHDLPGDVTIAGNERRIGFGRRGELLDSIELELVLGERREKLRVAEGGLLQ